MLIRSFKRLFEWAIPENIHPNDIEQYRQARVVIGFTFAIVPWAPVFALVYYFILHVVSGAIGLMVSGILGAGTLLVLKKSGSTKIAGNYLTVVAFAALIICPISLGNRPIGPLIWFTAIPFMAACLAGRRSSFIWAIVSVVTVATYMTLLINNQLPAAPFGENAGDIVLALGICGLTFLNTIYAIIYESAKNESLRKMSERVAIEEALAKAKAAEESNLAKSAFLANMSHELRTPMHGILSFAKFGLKSTKEEVTHGYLAEINDSAEKLMALLESLLDLSTLEAGKANFYVHAGDIKDVAKSVAFEYSIKAAAKNIQIQCKFPANLPEFKFDEGRITQVFKQLIENAIAYSNENSNILISASETQNGNLLCAIESQGVGIPESELESVFHKFTQSQRTRTGAGGKGLGLAICKEILKYHSGQIWAESTHGHTCFKFEIPQNKNQKLAS